MAQNTNANENFIVVQGLKKYFPVRAGVMQRVVAQVQAVDDVSFAIKKGETLGLVGESGCGKTTVGRTMLRLIEPTAGSVMYGDIDVFKLNGKELKAIRRDMQIIFQDPYASLDPRVPIGESVMEGLEIHNVGTHKERVDIMLEMLKRSVSRPITPSDTRTNSQAVNVSASGLRGRWRCGPSSSYAMNPYLPWMSRSNRRC